MGKTDIKTKVSDKATALWKGFMRKSPVFIVLTSLTVVSVLGLGVGGTLAATGVIPNPFLSQSSDQSSSGDVEGSSDQGRPPMGDGTLPGDVGEWGAMEGTDKSVGDELNRRGTELIRSGWTGTTYNFSKDGFYSYTLVNVLFPDNVTSKLEINGRLAISGTIHDCKPIAPERFRKDWSGHCSTMNNYPFVSSKDFSRGYFDACRPGGDTYVVESSGGGFYFRESGIIPPEFFECAPAEPTVSPTPESSSEPTTSPTPESTPTPEASSEPESSPTPTP
jgi:hypothetical protein